MSGKEVEEAGRKRRRRSFLTVKGGAERSGLRSPSQMGNRISDSFAVRRKAVQLYLEEGIGAELVAKEFGVSDKSVYAWARKYRLFGEAGLQGCGRGKRPERISQPVKDKITELKRKNPEHGVKRISQMLKSLFGLQASPKTVRKQIKHAGIATPKVKARRKPKAPERRFEAATPNQMWQSDITYYPILGKTAYIVGFIDDNSRYIVSLGVFRSQTAESVMETYRLAVGEFGAPKEMLTDNGRQYASWRGKTKFQKELNKDHVHHIRSAPHHPMTLGKIERFWQTLKDEFLSRARFETFEEAKERIAYWVKYYNHKRTHQGLDGMTPADRFFGIQKEMKAAIERHVAMNVEELALRGRTVEPFYMVGRMGDKSVVIETDKNRVSVMVDGEEIRSGQAMIYDMKERNGHEADNGSNGGRTEKAAAADVQCERKEPGSAGFVERQEERGGRDERDGNTVGSAERLGEAGTERHVDGAGSDVETAGGRTAETSGATGETDGRNVEAGGSYGSGSGEMKQKESENERNGAGQARSGGEMQAGVERVDGKEEGIGAVPGTGDKFVAVLPVAGSCANGYAGGTGTTGQTGRSGWTGVADTGQAVIGSQGAVDGNAERRAEPELAQPADENKGNTAARPSPDRFLIEEVKSFNGTDRSESGETVEGGRGSYGRPDHGDTGGVGARSESQDFLRVAGTGQGCDVPCAAGPADRPSGESCGSGKGSAPARTGEYGEGTGSSGKQTPHSGGIQGNNRGDAERVAVA
jgi:transposase InsO family protein